MRCKHIQEALSDYLEGGLTGPAQQEMAEHLSECARCAREEQQMVSMLRILHEQAVRHEPVIDLWTEFAPQMAAVRAEERLGIFARLRLRVSRFWGNVAYGAILFTQALAVNTQARMQKYLLADPFREGEEEPA